MSLAFKYCPFCGGHIPQNKLIKFCPFCGEKILMSENANEDSHIDTPKIVQETLKVEQLPPQQDEYAEIHTDAYKQKKMQNFLESECYSIILKNAPNKQELVRKLDKVLLRGSFAIRLAVDTVPSIIVYKAKCEDISYLHEVFLSEQASTSIVAGDFNNKPVIQDIFTMFDTLHTQIQKIIQQFPINLWIGDHIRGVFPNTYRENNEGITVITDKNIYFIPKERENSTCDWFVRSYHLLSKIVKENDCLRLNYKNNIVTSISFPNEQKLAEVYQCICQAVKV